MSKNKQLLLFLLFLLYVNNVSGFMDRFLQNYNLTSSYDFFTNIKSDVRASVNQLKNIKNETVIRIKEEIGDQIENLLETIKNEALANKDIQLFIKLLIAVIVIILTFSCIVLIFIAVNCYVMIFKQKVFSKDYNANVVKPYLKDQDLYQNKV